MECLLQPSALQVFLKPADADSIPAQFGQSLVVDAQVMGHFMKHRPPDFCLEFGTFEAEFEVWTPEDDDLVRHHAEVVTSLAERDPFIDTQDIPELLGGMLLDHHGQVVDLVDDPTGQLLEHPVDDLFEFVKSHERLIR